MESFGELAFVVHSVDAVEDLLTVYRKLEIIRLRHRRRSRHDLYSSYSVTVLKAFIDDSGSGGDSEWYVLAGYLGTVDGWNSFHDQWKQVLLEHPRIEYFKSSEAESLRSDGQWAGVSKEQRDAKIDRLIEVVGRCSRRAICARMRQRVYDELVKGEIPPVWDSPYYFLFPSVIAASINIERLDGEADPVDFVFDSDEKHEKGSKRLLPSLLPMQSYYGSLVNMIYGDEKKVLPLQAADLLAWQTRRAFSVPSEPRRRHFDAARNSPPEEPHEFIMTRSMVKSMIQEIRERAANLAPSLGRSPDVRTW
jgi:hypothetical protein